MLISRCNSYCRSDLLIVDNNTYRYMNKVLVRNPHIGFGYLAKSATLFSTSN